MSRTLLRMEGVEASFQGHAALIDIHMEILAGERFCVIGKNGSGKTVLSEIIAGRMKADWGTLDVLYKTVALVQAEDSLVRGWTVAENLYLTAAMPLSGLINCKTWNKAALMLLGRYGMPLEPHQAMGTAGKGLKKLVEVLKARLAGVELVVLDSILDFLDEREQAILMRILDDMKGEGTAVLVLNQQLAPLFDSFDRAALLQNGRIAKIFHKDEFRDMKRLLEGGESLQQVRLPRESRTRGHRLLTLRGIHLPPYLENVRFTVYQGDVVGVFCTDVHAGEALFNVAAGYQHDYGGTLFLKMAPLHPSSVSETVRSGIGIISDGSRKRQVFEKMAPAENMYLPVLEKAAWKGMVIQPRMERFLRDECNALLGLGEGEDGQALWPLDKNMEVRLIFNKWLLSGSQVIVMENPIPGADKAAKEELFSLMERAAAMDKGILFITGSMEDIMAACNRLVLIDDGKVAYDGHVEGYKNG